ncbi:MAG TPA: hypothetical protein VM030_04155 [Acidimicrobiales bacterium]|nr:hypothetical protein [Acidimicrobiales bacterium]
MTIGAAVIVGVILPVVWVLRALDLGEDSPVQALAVLAVFVGFVAGGWVASRRAARSPLTHAATAAGMAWALFIAVNLIRRLLSDRPITLVLVLTALVFLQVSVVLAMAGGWMAHRRAAVDQGTS